MSDATVVESFIELINEQAVFLQHEKAKIVVEETKQKIIQSINNKKQSMTNENRASMPFVIAREVANSSLYNSKHICNGIVTSFLSR